MNKRMNIVLIMADQMTAFALSAYGNRITRTPALDTLATGGMVFENAYCNYPLCAPSRFSMLTGRQPSKINAWDNAAEFPAAVPTVTHYLRAAGYSTTLIGKMHFGRARPVSWLRRAAHHRHLPLGLQLDSELAAAWPPGVGRADEHA
jgi:arylsulfatase A-like enzyme